MAVSPLRPALQSESVALIRRLFADHVRRHLVAYSFAGLLMTISAAATGLSAYLLKPVLDHMVETNGFETLKYLALAIAGLFLARGLATYGYLVLLARTGNHIVAQVQAELFDHLLGQPMAFFQDRHSSEFVSRLAVAATAIRDTLQVIIVSAGRDALTLAGLILVMIIQDARMAAIALALMPIGAYGLSRLIHNVRTLARSSFDGTAHILEIMQ